MNADRCISESGRLPSARAAAVGDTENETRRNLQEALAEHFQAMREISAPIPEPHTSVDYVEVAG
jgi:predicted RNase H-like HicB family nuclease